MCSRLKVLLLHPMQSLIHELLSLRSREEILATLDYFNALPPRQGRTEDLVKALCAYLSSDPKVWLNQLMECDLRMLQKLCHAGPDNSVDFIPADFPSAIEVLHIVNASEERKDDMLSVSIPRAIYELISNDIDAVIESKEQDGSFKLEHMILGAVNMFGAVPLRTFIDCITPDFESVAEMRKFAHALVNHPVIRTHQEEFMGESYMVSPDVVSLESLMKERRQSFKSVRRYAKFVPAQFEICGEHSPFCAYGRDTAEGKALSDMLDALGYVGEELIYTVHLVWINSQYVPNDHNLAMLLSPLTEAAGDIADYEQFVQCARVILDYANAAPKWLLKGNSANATGLMRYELPDGRFLELFDENEAAQMEEELMKVFDSVNKVRPVSPDEPCPCGSGLSYRLCHGRHFS